MYVSSKLHKDLSTLQQFQDASLVDFNSICIYMLICVLVISLPIWLNSVKYWPIAYIVKIRQQNRQDASSFCQ